MKPELMWLVWAVVLTVVQMLIALAGATLQVGLPMLAGNRDNMPALTGWVGRAMRAHQNMLENLVLLAALLFVAVVSGRTNDATLAGAQLFFWARLVYAIVYLAGVPWLRTAVWLASMVGLVMIFVQLL
ncbi:MAG TPA: MAPEG family protein [Burkholderiales bacterium]|nr:MAPEG family protein [Burkholderiales bacterium]